jgi:autotransporter-associated beta strand protein
MMSRYSAALNKVKSFWRFRSGNFILIWLLFLLIGTSFSADTLLVRYPFDQTSGTATIYDSSGKNNNGNAVNGSTFVPSFLGNAISLNGSNQYVQLPTGIVSSCTDITVSMWVKMNVKTTWMRLFDFGNGTTNGYMFLATLDDTLLRFAITSSNNNSEQRFDATMFPTNVWKHVAVRLKGDSAQIYLDGKVAATSTTITINPSYLGSTPNNYIGKSQYSNDPYLNGAIYDFRIYSNALTPANIANLYNSTKPVNFTWDSSTVAGYQPAKSGTWGTNNFWSPDGFALMQWPSNGGRAIFGGADGTYTITLSGTQNVDSISFLNSGYTLKDGMINLGTKNGIYVDSGKSVTINSGISGSGGLTMYARGSSSKLTLGGLNTYTGATNVKAGTLIINGSTSSNSAITVAQGATLAGTGNAAGPVTILKGGILRPGNGNAAKFSTGTLTLDSTSVLNWDLGTKSDTVAVAGDINLSGKLNIDTGAGYGARTYTIMTYTGAFTNNGLLIGPVPNGYSATISASEGSVRLTLYVPSKTRFTVNLPKNTAVFEGTPLILAAKAVVNLPIELIYTWHMAGSSIDSILKSDTVKMVDTAKIDTFKIDAVKMAINGKKIYCIAKNKTQTDSVTSDTTLITVTSASIPEITAEPGDLYVREGAQVPFTVTSSGSEPLSYTWYKDGFTKIVGTGKTFTITNAAKTDTGAYRCIVRNSAGSDTTRIASLKVLGANDIFNPIILRGSFVDARHVKLTISNFSLLPAQSPDLPYADGIGIWYAENSYPTMAYTISSPNRIYIPMNNLVLKNNSFDTIIQVNQISENCAKYFFSGSVYWKNPDSIPLFVSANGTSVFMCDTARLKNPLVLSGTYNGNDSILLTIDSLSRLKKDSTLYLKVIYSNNIEYVEDIIPAENLQDLPKYSKFYKDQMFTGDTTTILFKLVIRGILGNYSDTVTNKITVGKPRVTNNCVLKKDSIFATQVKLKWNSLASDNIDSIRIWYSASDTIPLDAYELDKLKYSSVILPGKDTTVLISGLNQLTNYYFGLQVFRDKLWSYVTKDSRLSVPTLQISDLSIIPNKLKILESSFDTTKNKLRFIWIVDTTGLDIDAGITWGLHDFPASDPDLATSKQIITIKPGNLFKPDTNYIDSTNFIYDSLYYFSIWLRKANGKWAQPTDSSKDTTRIPALKWQAVTYFPNKTDTIMAFANNVLLYKGNKWTGLVNDTLDIFKPAVNPSGFIPVSIGFKFRNNVQSPAFNIGIRYDAIPTGYKAGDIHMYMYNKNRNEWMIVDSCKTDTNTRMCSAFLKPSAYPYPYILMIDTQKPVISFSDTSSAVKPSDDIRNSIVLHDNISNVKVKLLACRGSESLSPIDSFTADSSTDSMELIIPGKSIVMEDDAFKAIVIISDGRSTDTVNISRKVQRTESDAFMTEADTWFPVASTAELAKTEVPSALGALAKDGSWIYNPVEFRIFRWVETESNKNKPDDKWIEYSDDPTVSPLFNLVPGRVIWVKTRTKMSVPVNLGSGKTVSFKQSFCDTLKANNWTDIALPYRFDIVIGDILDSSMLGAAADSIGFYKWEKTENSTILHPSPLSVGMIQGGNHPDSVLNNGTGQSYTIHNYLNRDIILKIPPSPSNFSKYKTTLTKKSMSSGWSFAIKAKTRYSDLTPMYCGYNPNGEGVAVFPCAPSFGKVQMSLIDQTTKHQYGHMTMHGKQTNGFAYQVLLKNGSSEQQTFKLTIDSKENIPEQIQLSIFNPVSKTFSSSSDADVVEVGANESQYRWVIAGDQNFKAQWLGTFQVFDLALMKPFPNPCRGNLNIKYTIPYTGVKEITLDIFDQLGRKVWSSNKRNSFKPGLNVLSWNPSKLRTHVAAGTYILRLTAINGKGKVSGIKQTRFLYLP